MRFDLTVIMNVSDTVFICLTAYDAEKEGPMRKDNEKTGSIN